MGKDILSYYGPDKANLMGGKRLSGTINGGQRDVMDYQPPTRVKTPYDPKGVGLHGDNCGPAGYQGASRGNEPRKQSSGAPGLGGSNRPAGSQGRR